MYDYKSFEEVVKEAEEYQESHSELQWDEEEMSLDDYLQRQAD